MASEATAWMGRMFGSGVAVDLGNGQGGSVYRDADGIFHFDLDTVDAQTRQVKAAQTTAQTWAQYIPLVIVGGIILLAFGGLAKVLRQ
jgi:hypothetical protein